MWMQATFFYMLHVFSTVLGSYWLQIMSFKNENESAEFKFKFLQKVNTASHYNTDVTSANTAWCHIDSSH